MTPLISSLSAHTKTMPLFMRLSESLSFFYDQTALTNRSRQPVVDFFQEASIRIAWRFSPYFSNAVSTMLGTYTSLRSNQQYLKEAGSGVFGGVTSSFQASRCARLRLADWVDEALGLVSGPSAVLSFFLGCSSSTRGLYGALLLLLSVQVSLELTVDFGGVYFSGTSIVSLISAGANSVILNIISQKASQHINHHFNLGLSAKLAVSRLRTLQ